ncbi:MAG TPA: pyridoxal-phosphate dependent enzyme [Pseudonocardiaceae bacterium]|nr:pyridoxal-phosphate dependent enzyme [Pseudonocardiaceae bacterium]
MKGLLDLPRVELCRAPTPLRPAARLSEMLGVEIWFKRDDLTGFGLGGNKVRALEYLLGDALRRGCDCLVTGAGPQSNWAMLAALGARQCGLEAHLVYYGQPVPATGNLLLAQLAGAQITFTGNPDRASVDAGIATLADKLCVAGHTPCCLPRGGATPVGALGYARASLELAEQLLAADLRPRQLWLATGSGGTQAGLLAGVRWLRLPYDVVGVTVSRAVTDCVQQVGELAAGVGALLGTWPHDHGDVTVLDGFLGPGYGVVSSTGEEAARLVAQTEGMFLDPVFGAKAMAALMSASGGVVDNQSVVGPVVFLLTGGAPTLFTATGGTL